MTAQELRIGNLVYPFDDISFVDDKTINRDCISVEWKDLEDTSHLYPIPLTHEWLERARAIFPYGDKRCQIGSLCFYWNNATINNYALYLQDSGFNESISDVPIKYVHTLQNVVQSLTGQELELK